MLRNLGNNSPNGIKYIQLALQKCKNKIKFD